MYAMWTLVMSDGSALDLKFISERYKKIAWGLQRLVPPRNQDWRRDHVQRAKKDTKTWLWSGLAFSAAYVLSFFLHVVDVVI